MFPPPPASGVRDDTSLTPVLHPKCWSHLQAGRRRVSAAHSVPEPCASVAKDAAHLSLSSRRRAPSSNYSIYSSGSVTEPPLFKQHPSVLLLMSALSAARLQLQAESHRTVRPSAVPRRRNSSPHLHPLTHRRRLSLPAWLPSSVLFQAVKTRGGAHGSMSPWSTPTHDWQDQSQWHRLE